MKYVPELLKSRRSAIGEISLSSADRDGVGIPYSVVPLVVAVLLWIATSILALTGIGLLLVPFVQFYGQLAVFRMFGSAFRTVSGRSTAPTGGVTAD